MIKSTNLTAPCYNLNIMKKTLFIVFILSVFSKLVSAQNFQYGKVTPEEMDMKTYPKDTSAHAVVL